MEKQAANLALSPISEILEEARAGRMYILVDAPDRENEGDLVIPAQMATPDAVNFMATHGRGLICLALEEPQAKVLDLQQMTPANQSRNKTAFTVSIEAREGITTGISAHDRAHTISTAISPLSKATDIVSPGHVFPLIARKGGVLVRAGHTEAAVDISRLAGLLPAGVICEIMNGDGSMARMDDLIPFAKKHGLKIGTIADLIAYRHRHDHFVEVALSGTLDHAYGSFDKTIYRSTIDGTEHLALTMGQFAPSDEIHVRMHGLDLMKDVIGVAPHKDREIDQALNIIASEKKGALILLNPKTSISFSKGASVETTDKQEASTPSALIEYGIGAQILSDLGVHKMILLTNSPLPKIIGLEGYDLEITGVKPLS